MTDMQARLDAIRAFCQASNVLPEIEQLILRCTEELPSLAMNYQVTEDFHIIDFMVEAPTVHPEPLTITWRVRASMVEEVDDEAITMWITGIRDNLKALAMKTPDGIKPILN